MPAARFDARPAGIRDEDGAADELAGIKNGRLLKLIGDSDRFDAFVTVDKNLPHQQNLSGLSFAIIVLRLKSNRVNDVMAHVPELIRRLPQLKPGDVIVLLPPSTKTL